MEGIIYRETFLQLRGGFYNLEGNKSNCIMLSILKAEHVLVMPNATYRVQVHVHQVLFCNKSIDKNVLCLD